MKFKHLLLVLPLLSLPGCPEGCKPEHDYFKTTEIKNVTAVSAICNVTLSVPATETVSEKGVCWSTSRNPTIEENDNTCEGRGAIDYYSIIGGLEENTTYYVRAYITTNLDTYYGSERSFTTPNLPQGAVKGAFSISETEQVLFSKGNLQYQASTDTWRFAEHQYDFVGDEIKGNVMENGVKCDNSLIAPDYDGWIDLFGWGTSGWNNGNSFYHPYDYYKDSIDGNHGFGYGPTDGFSYLFNLDGDYAESDWGYNAISNGGNQTRQWRTLNKDEWYYLMSKRPNASNKKTSATVNGVYGAIILPDYWVCPENITFNTGYNYQNNTFTEAQWQELEEAGAVFLPSAGIRSEKRVSGISGSLISGYYWLSNCKNEESTWFFNVFSSGPGHSVNTQYRSSGLSVRVVKANN